jgi:TetR/AcrR family transcriptional regulator
MASKKLNPRQNIQEKIVQAATHLFCQQGYGSTSVSQIVRRAGVSKPVLYYYFKSKAGLFNHLFEMHFGQFQEMIKRAIRGKGNAKEKILRLTVEQFDYCRNHLDRIRFVISTILGPQKGIPCNCFLEAKRINTRLFSKILKEGVAKGEIETLPFEEVGLLYIGMTNMFILKQLVQKHWALNHEIAKRIVDILFSGIGVSKRFEHISSKGVQA